MKTERTEDSSFFVNEFTETKRHIHTSSAWARSNLLVLQEVGVLKALKPHTASRTGLGSYLFFIVLEGAGTVMYDGEQAVISEGDCIFIDCRKEYSHASDDVKLWKLAWCHWTGNSMNGLYTKYVSRGGNWHFHAEDMEQYETRVRQIYQTAKSGSYILDVKINTLLSGLIESLFEETVVPDGMVYAGQTPGSARTSFDIQKAKEYIEEHFTEELSLGKVADALYVQKGYLCKLFKNAFGVSINNFIMQLRINKAKGLLRFSDSSISEIAYTCGMEDTNYFCRQFKKYEGMTPGEYRKQW